MWYVAAIAGFLAFGALAGYAKARGNTSSKKSVVLDAITSATLQAEMIQSLSLEEVDLMLARLESEEPPDPVSGAMCYAPMAYPEHSEYTCPLCGEKTLYNGPYVSLIEWGLPGARRLGESINTNTEFEIILDESLFCEYCSREIDAEPSLILRVHHEDGSAYVNPVSVTDLRMLDSFLQGNLFYFTSNDGQQPLKEYSERMRQLLGLME